jgi:hypothetical protein
MGWREGRPEGHKRLETAGIGKMPKQTDKIRITLDLSRKFYERLEELESLVGAESKAMVVRQALQLYEYVAQKASEGYSFRAVGRDGREHNVVFLGPMARAEDKTEEPVGVD